MVVGTGVTDIIIRTTAMATPFSLGIIALSTLYALQGVDGQNALGIKVSVSPPSGKVVVGDDLLLNCTVDKSKLGAGASPEWIRHTGGMQSVITSGFDKDYLYFTNKLYVFSHRSSRDNANLISYILTIRNIGYEDAGKMRCVVNNQYSEVSVAVCKDTSTKTCECMQQAGFATPQCFEEPAACKTAEEYEATVVGLGVCFAIAVIFGISMSILVGRDCIVLLHQKRQKQAKRLEMERQMRSAGKGPHGDSERMRLEAHEGETESQPESGVYSSSAGSNEAENGNGESQHNRYGGSTAAPPPPLQKTSPYDGNSATSRQQGRRAYINAQTHVNPAFKADEDSPPKYADVSIEQMEPAHGARPKTSDRKANNNLRGALAAVPHGQKAPSSERLYRAPSGENLDRTPAKVDPSGMPPIGMSGYGTPDNYQNLDSSYAEQSPSYGGDYEQVSSRIPSVSGNITQRSAKSEGPPYTPNGGGYAPEPRGAYTDHVTDKHHSRPEGHGGKRSAPARPSHAPRALNFVDGAQTAPQRNTHQAPGHVDGYDTVI